MEWERVDLARLDEDALTELIATAVGGPIDEPTVAVFEHLCQGNLVYLHELLVGAVEDGALRYDGDLWRLVAPAPLTPALTELIDRGLGPLAVGERELLEAVAVAEPLGPGELSAFGDPRLVEDLARRGLLASTLSGRRIEVRSGEPLFGLRLRSQMQPLVAARIARSLVEATEKTGGRRREDTLRIAWWGFEAGLPRPHLMLAVARAARWRYDFPLAERLAAWDYRSDEAQRN